jgi:hypothetical protein
MKNIISIISFCLFILLLSGCDDINGGTEDYVLSTDTIETSASVSILYGAIRAGDCTVDKIYYVSNDGEQIVSSPTFPWSVNINVDAGKNVYIKAVGKITKGSIILTMNGGDGLGYSFTDTVSKFIQ